MELADWLSGGLLDALGALRPRTEIGLLQIFTAPFLHLGLQHLLSNTTALIPLGSLMLLEGGFWPVSVISMVLGGLATWLFSTHVVLGFSGVLFGWSGYLMARGFYARRPLGIVLSLLVLVYFGGSVASGIVPREGISWAGHFWGLLSGMAAAAWLPVKRPR